MTHHHVVFPWPIKSEGQSNDVTVCQLTSDTISAMSVVFKAIPTACNVLLSSFKLFTAVCGLSSLLAKLSSSSDRIPIWLATCRSTYPASNRNAYKGIVWICTIKIYDISNRNISHWIHSYRSQGIMRSRIIAHKWVQWHKYCASIQKVWQK